MIGEIVIADTSGLIALNNIKHFHLLKDLFKKVLITPQVQQEYLFDLPHWIKIEAPVDEEELLRLCWIIDAGEASAIALAIEHTGSTLLIDEKDGRRVAGKKGVYCIGVLGLLLKAKRENKIVFIKPLINQLLETGFRISPNLVQFILQQAEEN